MAGPGGGPGWPHSHPRCGGDSGISRIRQSQRGTCSYRNFGSTISKNGSLNFICATLFSSITAISHYTVSTGCPAIFPLHCVHWMPSSHVIFGTFSGRLEPHFSVSYRSWLKIPLSR